MSDFLDFSQLDNFVRESATPGTDEARVHPLSGLSMEAKLAYLGILAFAAMADDGILQDQEMERIRAKARSLDVRKAEFDETVETIRGLKDKFGYLKEALLLVKGQEAAWYLVGDFLEVVTADGPLTENGSKLLSAIEKILGLSLEDCDFLKIYFDYARPKTRGGFKEACSFLKTRPKNSFDMERFFAWFTPELAQVNLDEAKGLHSFSNARYLVAAPYLIETKETCSFKDCEIEFVANGSINVNSCNGIDVQRTNFEFRDDGGEQNFLLFVKETLGGVSISNSRFSGNGKRSALAICSGTNNCESSLRVIDSTFVNLRKDKCSIIFLKNGDLWIERCNFDECQSPNANLIFSGKHLNVFASRFSNCSADLNLLCWMGYDAKINVVHNLFTKCVSKLFAVGYWGRNEGSYSLDASKNGLGVVDCCLDKCSIPGFNDSKWCYSRLLNDDDKSWVTVEEFGNVRSKKGQVYYCHEHHYNLICNNRVPYVRWEVALDKLMFNFDAGSPERLRCGRFIFRYSEYMELVAHQPTEISDCIFVDTAVRGESKCLENKCLVQFKKGVMARAMVTFKNCIFSGNFARAAFCLSQDVFLDHCKICDFASMVDGWAAVGVTNDAGMSRRLVAKDCIFENLESGNVSCAWGMDVMMERCRFVNCFTRRQASIVAGFKIVLRNCAFERCNAGGGGSALVGYSGNAPLPGSQVVDCKAINCTAQSVQCEAIGGNAWEIVN